jgi:hypothetical protein
MSKLDLNQYTDRQIVSALVELRAEKFLTVLNSLARVSKRLQTRGEAMADDLASEDLKNKVRKLFEE